MTADELTVEEAYAAVRPHQGRTFTLEIGRVTDKELARFSASVGEGAHDDGSGTRIVDCPPLYLTAVQGWAPGPPESELRPDGADREQLAGVPVEGLRLMGAGQDVEFLGDFGSDDLISEDVTVNDVVLKQGRSGPLLIITLLRVFRTGDRELLRCTERFIGR